MTDYAEGAETPEEMEVEDSRDRMRREHTEDATRIVLGAPCASWMQEGREDAAA